MKQLPMLVALLFVSMAVLMLCMAVEEWQTAQVLLSENQIPRPIELWVVYLAVGIWLLFTAILIGIRARWAKALVVVMTIGFLLLANVSVLADLNNKPRGIIPLLSLIGLDVLLVCIVLLLYTPEYRALDGRKASWLIPGIPLYRLLGVAAVTIGTLAVMAWVHAWLSYYDLDWGSHLLAIWGLCAMACGAMFLQRHLWAIRFWGVLVVISFLYWFNAVLDFIARVPSTNFGVFVFSSGVHLLLFGVSRYPDLYADRSVDTPHEREDVLDSW